LIAVKALAAYVLLFIPAGVVADRFDRRLIATTDGLVLALDGASFLAMVSGAASIRGRLLNLYEPSAAATIAVP